MKILFSLLFFLIIFSYNSYGNDNKVVIINILGENLKFLKVDAGCFSFGDLWGDGDLDEIPVKKVCLDDFYIMDSEVTQSLFEKVLNYNPSHIKMGGDYPVDSVTLYDVDLFIKKISLMTNHKFRLPTEEEWEKAAKGKVITKWSGTDLETELNNFIVYDTYSSYPIKSKLPNDYGLYDMSGNVWEWVDKEVKPNFYIIKGGGWSSKIKDIRTSNKSYSNSGEG